MIKTVDGKDFDNSITYYKVTNKEENHHELQYHDGLNVDPIPFNYRNICIPGGMYFTEIKNIFEFLNFGCYIREITVPDDALVFKEDHKYKADKLIFGKRMDINLDAIKYFAEKGEDINATYSSALSWAARKGYFDIFKYLVEKGADIHARNSSALKWAAQNGHLNIIKYLVEKGADIHACNDYTIGLAAGNDQLDTVKYLIDNGVDIHVSGDYALINSVRNNHLDIVKYLIEKGADIHANNDEALRWAVNNGHTDMVDYIKSLK